MVALSYTKILNHSTMETYVQASHPKFKSSVLVLCRQLAWQMVSCAIFVAAPDAVHVEVLRYPLHFFVPDGFRIPEILIATYTLRQLWASRTTAAWIGLSLFCAEDEYETHRRIVNPLVREWLWFACSVVAWAGASWGIRTWPAVAVGVLGMAYAINGVWGMPFVAPFWSVAEPECLEGNEKGAGSR